VRLREGHDKNFSHPALRAAFQPGLTQEKRLAGAINCPRLRSNLEFSVRHKLGNAMPAEIERANCLASLAGRGGGVSPNPRKFRRPQKTANLDSQIADG
jgi:hypothetical protein